MGKKRRRTASENALFWQTFAQRKTQSRGTVVVPGRLGDGKGVPCEAPTITIPNRNGNRWACEVRCHSREVPRCRWYLGTTLVLLGKHTSTSRGPAPAAPCQRSSPACWLLSEPSQNAPTWNSLEMFNDRACVQLVRTLLELLGCPKLVDAWVT